MQKRRHRSSRTVSSSKKSLPKEKKTFCCECKQEFPLKKLHSRAGKWYCDPCLLQRLS